MFGRRRLRATDNPGPRGRTYVCCARVYNIVKELEDFEDPGRRHAEKTGCMLFYSTEQISGMRGEMLAS